MDKTGMGAKIGVEVRKSGALASRVPAPRSAWDVVCRDKFGTEKWREKRNNLVTNEALEALLNIMFLEGTQIADWYVSLIEDGDSPEQTSTYAAPVFTECTVYTETNRPAFVGELDELCTVWNKLNKAVFTMNASKDLLGGALVGGGSAASTKGDTAGGGILYCAIEFGQSRAVVSSDVVSIEIDLTSSSV